MLTWSKRRSGRLIKNICTDILEVFILTVPVHTVYAPTLGARSRREMYVLLHTSGKFWQVYELEMEYGLFTYTKVRGSMMCILVLLSVSVSV